MTTTPTTTTPEKTPATGSPSSPGSTESGATASPTGVTDVALVQLMLRELKSMNDKMDSMGNDFNDKMDSMGNDFNDKMDSMGNDFNDKMDSMGNDLKDMGKDMDQRFNGIGEDLKDMKKNIALLKKRSSYLVEEASRTYAAEEFPGDLNRSYAIKTIHNFINLIAQANASALPDGDPTALIPEANASTLPDDDSIARAKKMENELVDFLYPLLPVFLEAAVNQVVETTNKEAVFNSEALEDAKKKIRKVQEELKAAAQADTQPIKAKLVQCCGIVMGSVKELSTTPIDGESKTDQVSREKMMNKRFQLKLLRLKQSLGGEKHCLATSEGAGILMCNALAAAGRTVWEGGKPAMSGWIREKCIGKKHSIFEFKQEMECDVCPSVEIKPDNSVALKVGEIKTSIDAKKAAVKQMQEQVRLLEFGLWFFRDTIKAEKIVKTGHFYFSEAKDDHQGLRNKDEKDDFPITMHNIGHSNATES